MKCWQCGAFLDGNQVICPFCGAQLGAQGQQTFGFGGPGFGGPGAPVYYRPMKWYKFLIYFLLFAGAVINVFSAIGYFTGTNYEDYAFLVYQAYPSLRVLDIFAGLFALGMAVLGIVTRFALAGMKRNGPKLLCLLYVLNGCFTLIYSFAIMGVVGIFDVATIASTVVSAGVAALMVWANYVYFNNRRELFIR